MKYCVVTGGVVSGLGKGITSSSIGLLLKACGLTVTSIKIDPYLNTDAGTMSPYEHGECYVLDDGGECDLDMGNYERFLHPISLTKDHNITTGKIYNHVITRERRGDYLGKTVQVVPHVVDAVREWVERVARLPTELTKNRAERAPTTAGRLAAERAPSVVGAPPGTAAERAPMAIGGSGVEKGLADVCLIELGGTVGDIESMMYLEALRQLAFRVGSDNFCLVHVSLVPSVGLSGEQKSKPTQHGIKELRAAGLNPDLIVCRSSQPLDKSAIEKISHYSMIPADNVLSVHDVTNIYRVPLLLLQQRLPSLLLTKLHINKMPPKHIPTWTNLAQQADSFTTTTTTTPTFSTTLTPTTSAKSTSSTASPESSLGAQIGVKKKVNIVVVGKYTGLTDSYLSLSSALKHAAIHLQVALEISWVDAEQLLPQTPEPPASSSSSSSSVMNVSENAWESVRRSDGVLVPGGFGDRGVEGMIAVAEWARKNQRPFLGICLGMQVMVIEFCRNVLGYKNAHSAEFDKTTEHPVIIEMPEIAAMADGKLGGTMRLGLRPTQIKPNTMAHSIYANKTTVHERHRHRFEVNPAYIPNIQTHNSLTFSGTSADDTPTSTSTSTSLSVSGSGSVDRAQSDNANLNDSKDQTVGGARMEICELPASRHPFYFGCQFHPEFLSRPLSPSPPFSALLTAARQN